MADFWSVKILVYKLRLNVDIDFCLRNVTSREFQSLMEFQSFISVTHITQRHIQKRVDNKYRKEAEALMEHVLQLNLGEIVTAEYQAGKQKREKKTLVKRKIDDLDEEQKNILND